jgi:leucyl-tRNA synthetase
MIDRFGADATRMYSLFAAPPDRDLEWQEDGVAGVSRFLGKVYRFVSKYAARVPGAPAELPATLTETEQTVLRKLHQTIRKISEDFADRWHFNTSIAAIMEFVNTLTPAEESIDAGEVSDAAVAHIARNLILLLAPLAPYITAELWENIGETSSLLRAPWPVWSEALAEEHMIEIPIQINGKLCSVITVPRDADDDTMREAVQADEKVQARLAGRMPYKVILLRNKLINLVVK